MTQKRVRFKDHIFLSYRSLEREFALKLAAELRSSGAVVWVDCLENGILPADDWPKTIEESLNSCTALIAVVSPEYVASNVCQQELSRASRLGAVLFPVLLKPISPEQYPLAIERIQFVDFTNWQDGPSFKKAFSSLFDRLLQTKNVIGQKPDPEQHYLSTLIADLEAMIGVSNYIYLSAEVSGQDEQNAESTNKATEQLQPAFDAEFMLLIRIAENKPAGNSPQTPKKIDNISETFKELKRFVLLGEPGAGKTTTLRQLVLETARARLLKGASEPLPLLLQLSQWQKEHDLEGFLESVWPFDSDFTSAIAAGQVIVFLDGLNEMGGQGITKSQSIKKWIDSSNVSQQLVVTCRIQDYNKDFDLCISEVTVQPINNDQIQGFAKKYLAERAQDFITAIQVNENYANDNRNISALARNPYLLICLIILFQKSPARTLPRNPGSLFSGLVEFLWERERGRHTRGWLPFKEAQDLFALLAFQMIEEDKPNSVPLRYVSDILGGEDILHCGISANILFRVGDQVRFYHQLIQEYFAAVYLKSSGLKNLHMPLNTKWYEVMISLSGIAVDTDAMVLEIAGKDPYVAGRCIQSGAPVLDATRQLIISTLNEEMQSSIPLIERRQHEEYPDRSWSSNMMMEDALQSYFSNYIDDLKELLRRVESARLSR